jgi:D-glycero-D-manno-heptose 1,7-bisphosphate phosphatase
VSSAAVFVDRDGVINELVVDPASGLPESPLTVADVSLIDGAAAALRRLSRAGWTLVGVSNQPAAAKGRLPVSGVWEVQGRVIELLAAEGVALDDFRLCLHHPAGVVPELSGACDCRKPAPGMLVSAAADLGIDLAASWMVGDTEADVSAGRAAGCRTILVTTAGSEHKRSAATAPDLTAPDLAAAADRIVAAT